MKIAIFGTVGSGKTTFTEQLSKKLGFIPIFEEFDNNPYWNDYYKDIKKWSFHMQVYFLMAKTKSLINSKILDNVIFDRTILEDPIFVEVQSELGLMSKRDSETYKSFFNDVVKFSLELKHKFNVDYFIYLKVSTKKAVERIVARNRDDEKDMDYNYWETLNKKYNDNYEKLKNDYNFIVIDADDDDLEKKLNLAIKKIKG